MGSRLQNFVNGLISQDYMLFLSVLFVFLFIIILAVLLRNRLKIAVFLVFLAFGVIIAGPTYGYVKMHKYLFKNSVELLEQKKLSFVEAVVVKGKVTNLSQRDFKECKITASVYKMTANKYKNYIYQLKPFQKVSIVTGNILQGDTKEFKIIVEPFRYQKDYNISLEGDCK
ncbi:DUF2393 domain-containing protein [Sulfurimonas sp.]|uniref:DUF2393 domain-containing protein n=1 Tax=Sulfurimonas sp. TaxID=2022749 RepID=UPI003D143A96